MATPPVLRVVEREARVFAKLWRGVVFSMVLSPILFLAAMGVGLGSLVNEHSGNVRGLSYIDFVAPGLLVTSAVQMAASEGMWPVLGAVKWIKNFHATVATAITSSQLVDGFVLWVALRGMGASAIFLAVAALLGAIPSAWGVLAIPAAALCGAAFCAPLCAYSVGLESDMSFPVIIRVVILPLTLFSGVFFPLSELPGWLQTLVQLSPMWHGVALARDATTGSFHLWADVGHVTFLVACTAIGLVLARRAFAKRLAA